MSHVIRIHEDVAARISELARPGESVNATIRRLLGLEPYPGLRRGRPS